MEKYDFARQEAASLQVELDALVREKEAARETQRLAEQSVKDRRPKGSSSGARLKTTPKPRVETTAVVAKKPKPISCRKRFIAANGLFL